MSRFKNLLIISRKANEALFFTNKSNLFNNKNCIKYTKCLFSSNQTELPDKELQNNDLPKVISDDDNKPFTRQNFLKPGSGKNVDLSEYGSIALPSFHFSPYADSSPLLQEFIKLGVQLYKLEKRPEVGEFLLTLDFDKDVKPYLVFLNDHGVSPDNFGEIITKHPFLFKQSIEDVEVRINYLVSKKFTKGMISNIISKYPQWLSIPVKRVDSKLGELQKLFELKGDDVRTIISKTPSIISKSKIELSEQLFLLKEDLELELPTIRKMCLLYPTLLRKRDMEVIKTYDYLIKVMKVQKFLIENQPQVLSCRKFILEERHGFLSSLGRAQYNPKLPGYVNLIDLVGTKDELFCERVAKTSVKMFYDYLKTL